MSQSQFTPPTGGLLRKILAEDAKELVAKLIGSADPTITRAADLLGQRHPAPVPVSKRPWEREGWRDESGRYWMGDPGGARFIPSWRLCRPEDAPNRKVSLPALALPLPAGEVER